MKKRCEKEGIIQQKISIPIISVNVPAEWWEEMEEEGVADKVIVLGQ